MFRKFELSDNLFGGFFAYVDIDTARDMEDLCKMVTLILRDALRQLNLDMLVPKLQQKQFHIHCPSDDFGTLKQILTKDDTQTTYLCGGCKSTK